MPKDSASFFTQKKLLILVLSVIALSLIIQLNVFFNQDVSWLMHAGQRLLAGGNYYHDFFEPNPPMSIFLYLPAVLLANVLHISFIKSSLVFTFFVALLAFTVCYKLANHIFNTSPYYAALHPGYTGKKLSSDVSQKYLFNFFILSLSFVYFILPAGSFSEREHLMLLLVFPYLLVACLHLQHKRIPTYFSIISGLLAGIGFCIKPHFYLLWIMIEIYLMIKRKTIFKPFPQKNSGLDFLLFIGAPVLSVSWRWENFFIVIIGLGYAASILLVTPDYLTQVLPVLLKYYYIGFGFSWYLILSNGTVIFLSFSCLLYLVLRHYCEDKNLTDILLITTLALLIIYAIQRATWYYHILPALSTGTLLLTLLACNVLTKSNLTIETRKSLYWLFTIFLLFPISNAVYLTSQAVWLRQYSIRNQFIHLVNQQARGGTIYFFSDLMTPTYPLVDYTNTKSTSRYPCLWMFLSIELMLHHPFPEKTLLTALDDQKFFSSTVIEDLIKNPPNLIFVQVKSPNWQRDVEIKVNYINILSRDSRFQPIWKNYSYLENLGDYAIYKQNLLRTSINIK